MAKRRSRKQDDSDAAVLILVLIGLAVAAGIGSYVLKAFAWAAVALGVVIYTLLGAIAFDLIAIVWARLNGERRSFTATRAVWSVVSYPFRLTRRLIYGPPLRVETIGELLVLTPAQFEEAVATLLRDHGYTRVKRVGGAGDLGVDLTCRGRDGRTVAVQCKRYGPGGRVTSKDIQLFIGMTVLHHRVDRGIYVTTSYFTRPAAELAKKHKIEMIDGERLARLLPNGAPVPVSPSPTTQPTRYASSR